MAMTEQQAQEALNQAQAALAAQEEAPEAPEHQEPEEAQEPAEEPSQEQESAESAPSTSEAEEPAKAEAPEPAEPPPPPSHYQRLLEKAKKEYKVKPFNPEEHVESDDVAARLAQLEARLKEERDAREREARIEAYKQDLSEDYVNFSSVKQFYGDDAKELQEDIIAMVNHVYRETEEVLTPRQALERLETKLSKRLSSVQGTAARVESRSTRDGGGAVKKAQPSMKTNQTLSTNVLRNGGRVSDDVASLLRDF